MFRWQYSKKLTQIGVLLALLSTFGCSAAKTTAHDGEQAAAENNWDAAVFHYLQAVTEEPANIEYRMQLLRARQKASQAHFTKGLGLRDLGRVHRARDELQMAVQLDPANQFATQVLEEVQQEIEILSGPGGDQALAEMKRRASEAKVQPPVLDPSSDEAITLRFPQAKPVKEIYQAVGKAYGFNVIFDPKLKDDKLSVELNDVKAERALEIVMQAAGHFYKVYDEHTIIVAEDTPQNRREYEDLVIKTFFLSNADVKEVDKLLRALIEARRLATNEQLNAITLRDTADKVAIAEKLIRINDKAKAEVLVDVELLLMASSANSDIGMTLSSYSFNLIVDTDAISEGTSGALPLDQLNGIDAANTFINIPSLVINLIKGSGRAEVLAQPQLRITEGEKANLHIGDRYPIPVTSFNSSNTIGGSVVPITSFQYQDIGIKIEVEPRVHHNREVTLNLSVEVSNLGETVSVGPTQEAIVIGTRNITSVIRLKSGETSLLAGLFRTDTTEGQTDTPGLSAIPLIGRLFTNKTKTEKRTDLVLTLTPHIVRFPSIVEEDLAPLWVGTESRISFFGGNSPRVASGSGSPGPFDRKSSAPQSPRESQVESSKDRGRSSGSAFHARTPSSGRAEPAPNEPARGVDLVSGGGDKSAELGDVGLEETQENVSGSPADNKAGTVEYDIEAAPVLISLQPSVVSLGVDRSTLLQIVATGDYDGYRLPIDLKYDPDRISVEGLEASGAVGVLDQVVDPEQGWIHLDLIVSEGGHVPQIVATLEVRALGEGPSPLIFSSRGVETADGRLVAVAATDGAVFATSGDDGWEGGQ